MKKVIVALSVMFLSVAVFAQNATPQKKAEDFIKFKELTYDFGKIKQGTPVTHDFQFRNIAGQPVVIEFAQASCGCTTPTWPQAAISADKNDKVTAGFNAAAPGPFNKTITVKVAGVETPVLLTITGEVLTAEDHVKYEASKKKPGSKK